MNTQFFHQTISARKKKKHISKLHDGGGVWIEVSRVCVIWLEIILCPFMHHPVMKQGIVHF